MTASVAPSFNLQKVHKAVDRTGYLPMNEWITTNPCNVSADTCANALNSPAGYFLLLYRAIWNETHRSTTSSASRSFSDFCIAFIVLVSSNETRRVYTDRM